MAYLQMQTLRQGRPRGFLVVLLVGALLLLAAPAAGPRAFARPEPETARVPERELRAGKQNTPSLVPAPPARRGAEAQAALVEVTYAGFAPEAQAAFQRAVDIWAQQIASPVPIKVEAYFQPLDPGVLGSAGPTRIIRGFPGAVDARTWYPIAIANRLANDDLLATLPDITARFNSTLSAWYFGLDGNPPPGKFDFVSVVLHELGHGLGFVGSMDVSDLGVGSWGTEDMPFIFDRFAKNGLSQRLIDLPNNTTLLGAELVGGGLIFDSPHAVAANGGVPPLLYAPAPWDAGSSFSHLDEAAFGVGHADSLMTPILNPDEAIHSPGPTVLGMLQDMGWTTSTAPPIVPPVRLTEIQYLPSVAR